MKAVIFAGGVGTRLWPLSRKKSPKQFEKIIDKKSTLQLTVERLRPEFKPEDIFISTGHAYIELIQKQLPFLPKKNIIGEPYKKDVGPAVAYVIGYLARKHSKNEPVVILWSDHIVRREKHFKKILFAAEKLVSQENRKIVFIGQKARFASDNLGWIKYGNTEKKINGIGFYKFEGFKYKPDKKFAETYFKDNRHCWNLGYFVSTPEFILDLFKKFAPKIYAPALKILDSIDTKIFNQSLEKNYANMPSINFDNAVLEQLEKKYAYVVVEDIGWSDVGAWEALKEALEQTRQDNIMHGNVLLKDSTDNLVYNYDDKKLIVGVDLSEILVVNTDDVLLVAKKSSVSKIKKIVESFQGTKNERLI